MRALVKTCLRATRSSAVSWVELERGVGEVLLGSLGGLMEVVLGSEPCRERRKPRFGATWV